MNSKIGQFIKGLGIMIAIIYTAYQSGANIWPVAVLTAIVTGIGYYVSNYWKVSSSDPNSVNLLDIAKAAILSAVTALVPLVATFWDGTVFDWKSLGVAALSAFLAYLFPTFFQPGKTDIVVPPNPPKP